jgi:sugar phosphate isomerase/epimerase
MRVGLFIDISEHYAEKIRAAKELGFDCGQLCMWNMDFYTSENLEGLKTVLEREAFEVTGFWCGWSEPVVWKYPEMYQSLGLVPDVYRERRMEDLRRGAKFAFDLGIKNVITHTGYLPDDPTNPAHIAIVRELRTFCKELRARGQKFLFETGEELPLTLSILIGEIGLDNVGINFDPANFITTGRGNPQDAMELLVSRVMGMHAKDGVPAKFGEVKGRQVRIGEGRVDFRNLLTQLRDGGYKGDIYIEHEMPGCTDRNRDLTEAKSLLDQLTNEIYA